MKITKKSEVIEVCDICQTHGYLKSCIVCHRQYCLIHESILIGCFVQPAVCCECGKRDDVEEVIEQFKPTFRNLVENRNKALSKLATTERPNR